MQIRFSVRPKNTGDRREVRYELEDRVLIGRSPDSPVQFDDPNGISRDHFALQRNGGQVVIVDLSSNGTWLDGRRLEREEPRPIRDAETIEVPGYSLEFYIEGAGEPSARQPAAIAEPAESRSRLSRFAGSLTGFEKFLTLAALCSLGLVVYYLVS